jgi:hypothetical protein
LARVGKGQHRKRALPAGKFREYSLEIAIDDANVAVPPNAVPVVNHRIVGRAAEQPGAKSVKQPPMMLGFSV